jgi:cyclic beta-1,2-glucan glucanotransferase
VRRGGWTWYTGAAGWLYRAGIESILGLTKVGGRIYFNPCIPREWPGYTINLRFGATNYEIAVENPAGVMRGVERLQLDGGAIDPGAGIELVDDGQQHRIAVVLG